MQVRIVDIFESRGYKNIILIHLCFHFPHAKIWILFGYEYCPYRADFSQNCISGDRTTLVLHYRHVGRVKCYTQLLIRPTLSSSHGNCPLHHLQNVWSLTHAVELRRKREYERHRHLEMANTEYPQATIYIDIRQVGPVLCKVGLIDQHSCCATSFVIFLSALRLAAITKRC